MKERSVSRVDQHAKTASEWLNSLLVGQWSLYSKLGDWKPVASRWPDGLEIKPSDSTSDLLTKIIELLEIDLHEPHHRSEDFNAKLDLQSAVLKNLTREDLTSTTPHHTDLGTRARKPDSEAVIIDELTKRLRKASPYLVEFGGNSRQILKLPAYMWHQIPQVAREAILDKCEILHVEHLSEPILVSIGTDLDLENLVERLFLPTAETWNLVPRILSRVDIDWIPFTISG
jgi:hypothetical protein